MNPIQTQSPIYEGFPSLNFISNKISNIGNKSLKFIDELYFKMGNWMILPLLLGGVVVSSFYYSPVIYLTAIPILLIGAAIWLVGFVRAPEAAHVTYNNKCLSIKNELQKILLNIQNEKFIEKINKSSTYRDLKINADEMLRKLNNFEKEINNLPENFGQGIKTNFDINLNRLKKAIKVIEDRIQGKRPGREQNFSFDKETIISYINDIEKNLIWK